MSRLEAGATKKCMLYTLFFLRLQKPSARAFLSYESRRAAFVQSTPGWQPFTCQHGIDHQIGKVVMEPFSLAHDAFLGKPQALRNSTASRVALGAENLHAVQMQFLKRMVGQRAASQRHQAASLERLAQPVAKLGLAIEPVNIVIADHPGQRAAIPDACRKPAIIGKLLERAADKAPAVG